MFTSTAWEKSYAHSPWCKRWQQHPNAPVKPQMMPLQNTTPYNVWHHDDQGSSTSIQTTCLIVWGEKHLTVQANSATILDSLKTKTVTDQTLWCWATRLLKTESYGISDRCFTRREKSQAIFKQEANAPDPSTYTLPWRHAIWHFVVAFSHLPQPFPLKTEYLGSFLESAVRKGSPRSTTFFYLYQQHYCTSSNIFYI